MRGLSWCGEAVAGDNRAAVGDNRAAGDKRAPVGPDARGPPPHAVRCCGWPASELESERAEATSGSSGRGWR